LSTKKLVIWIAFLGIVAMAARVSIDSDTWWHLRAGQWMVENRALMQVDSFSYTRAGTAWQYPGIWIEILFYKLYQVFGLGGLNLWTTLMVTVAFASLWPSLSGNVFLRALVIIFSALVSAIHWVARPHLVTFVLAAIFLWVLEDYRWGRGKPHIKWLPVLMVIWVNSHGGYLAGFLIWGVYFVGLIFQDEQINLIEQKKYRLRQLLVVGFWMVLATLLNPQGISLLSLPFTTVSRGAEQLWIAEWQTPNFHELRMQPFAWLLLLTLGAVGASNKRLALVDFFLVTGFGYLGLIAARNIPLFAFTAAIVLTRHADDLYQSWAKKREISIFQNSGESLGWQVWVNRGLVIVLIFAVAVKLGSVMVPGENLMEIHEAMPADAVQFIKEAEPQGRLFNAYNWGGYLIWALPGYPVFVDGRADLHGDEIINQWVHVIQAKNGWQEILATWDISLILLEPYQPVARLLPLEGWSLLYEDDIAVVYGR